MSVIKWRQSIKVKLINYGRHDDNVCTDRLKIYIVALFCLGFCSPSRDSILHEADVGKCSPSFLKFVKETCRYQSYLDPTESM